MTGSSDTPASEESTTEPWTLRSVSLDYEDGEEPIEVPHVAGVMLSPDIAGLAGTVRTEALSTHPQGQGEERLVHAYFTVLHFARSRAAHGDPMGQMLVTTMTNDVPARPGRDAALGWLRDVASERRLFRRTNDARQAQAVLDTIAIAEADVAAVDLASLWRHAVDVLREDARYLRTGPAGLFGILAD